MTADFSESCTPIRPSRRRTPWLGLYAVALACWLGAGQATAQNFDVPDGFVVETLREAGLQGRSTVVMKIKPEPGTFSDLSALELRPVEGPIENPETWLRARLTADFGAIEAFDDVFDSPDTPFEGSLFDQLRSALEGLGEQLSGLGRLPLTFCEDAAKGLNEAGPYTQLTCDFDLGPVHKYLVLRLQEVDGVWYYTAIDTMNERRLRHLVAIANSFRVD